MDGTVLIADDDRSIRMVLTQALSRAGCRVHATGSLTQLARWVEEGRGNLVITDVAMPDGNGIDLIPALHRARPDLPVIVISAQNTIVTAVRAQAAEAFDYLPKPFDLPELMARARAALARGGGVAGGTMAGAGDRALGNGGADDADHGVAPAVDPAQPLVGHAPAMQALFRLVARLLNTDLPVLVTGEAGTGRTTIARSLHDLSARRDKGLATLDPADLGGDGLARLQTVGLAGGTLFIEDPAGFDPEGQAKLAALLQSLDGVIPAPRVVAIAAGDVRTTMTAGRLRPDLYWRLAGATLEVPPLRARTQDIPDLARHFLRRAEARGLPARTLDEAAVQALLAHHFPGNLRELENLVLRLSLEARGPRITAAELEAALTSTNAALPVTDGPGLAPVAAAAAAAANPDRMTADPPPSGTTGLAFVVQAQLRRYFALHGDDLPPAGLYERVVAEVERPLIEQALAATGGNQLRAAELLGINRNTLRKKLATLTIGVTRTRRLM